MSAQPRRTRLPGLLIVTESATFPHAGLRELRGLMADATRCVYAVLFGDSALASHHEVAGFTVQPRPLGPADLQQFEGCAAAAAPAAGAHHAGAGPRPLMLVVDHDAANRLAGIGIGRHLGFDASSAADGVDALAACRAAPPAVIVMDVEMPRMNGLQAARLIRVLQRHGRLPPCPILAAMHLDDAATRRACVEAGMDACLVKPLDATALRRCLRRLGSPAR